MKSGLKLVLMGGLFGFLGVFAFIGVQSLLTDKEKAAQVSSSAVDNGYQKPTIKGAATPDNTGTEAPVTAPANTEASTPATQPSPTTSPANVVDNAEIKNTQTDPSTSDNKNTAGGTNGSARKDDDNRITLIDEYGELRLTLVDPANSTQQPRGTFIIRDEFSAEVATINEVNTASFDLSPGIYEVTAIAEGKKSARMVEITLNQVAREQFDLPRNNQPVVVQQPINQPSASAPGTSVTTQEATSPNEEAQPSEPTASETVRAPATQSPEGQLTVQVRAEGSSVPLKANIYVQKPNGVNVTKQNYTDSAAFALSPGPYRLTVKTKGKRDVVRDIVIQQGRNLRQVIAMPPLVSQPPRQQQAALEGTVNMVLALGVDSRGRFIIQDARGRRVARIGGVADASVRLRPGNYTVMAVYQRERARKRIVVRQGENTTVTFRAQDFPGQGTGSQTQTQNNRPPSQPQPPTNTQQNNAQALENQGGLLQLIAVNGIDQRPLPVSFSVTTLNGRVLQNYNNVSFAELNLDPQDVLVNIRYREMSGQERIRIKADEPTVFTFTITPNDSANPVGQQDQPPQDLEALLLERLQQELLRRIQ